ncbi:MAG: SufD family Fe-S cluster assembly protein, partial [Atopobiaceae bacterium]|nr:SufD family Fe-S cluster assembly protein [Atopobiaceae bacterium]
MAETMLLSHVNTPPAQTWNYLRVNDISLEVPVPTDHGAAFNRLPRVFDSIECGLGDEARDWIVASVPEARYIEVPAHTRRDDPIVVVATAGENAYSDTGVCIREGAEATVVVAA